MLRKSFAAIAAVPCWRAAAAARPVARARSQPRRRGTRGRPAPVCKRARRPERHRHYLIGAVVLGLIIWGIIELTKSDEGPRAPDPAVIAPRSSATAGAPLAFELAASVGAVRRSPMRLP